MLSAMTLLRRVRAAWRLGRRRGAAVGALRLLVLFLPSERRRVLALTIVAGVVCGAVAVAFHLTIRLAESLMIDRALAAPGAWRIALCLLTPAAGGLACGILLHYVVPDARGSGIPQVKEAYALKGGRVSLRVAAGKFFASALQIGSGASLGREGPTVHICAGVVSALGRAAALSRQNLTRLLPVAAAAGIAAAFNAPIAAVTFALEEIVGDLDQTMLSGVVVAAALAAVTERGVLGEHPVFAVPRGYGLHYASSLALYAALGVAASAVSIAFSESLLAIRARFKATRLLAPWARPAVGGLATGALAVVALVWLRTGGVTGGGYETLLDALSGRLALGVLLALGGLKLVATALSYGSGGAGGIFAPSLFVGGMLGGAVGWCDVLLLHHPQSEVGAFALVGMGAVFAGVVRAPITSVLIIFEMTDGYSLVLPLMIANMTAYALARRWRPAPIYDALLEQDGIHLPHRRGAVSHALEHVRVAEAMTAEAVALEADMTAGDARARAAELGHETYPVVDASHAFVGLVTTARLRRAVAEGAERRRLDEIADRKNYVHPDYSLTRAAVRMSRQGVSLVAVVDRETRRLLGVVSMTDIVRAQARAADAVADVDVSILPGTRPAGSGAESG
jgi:CIC family chloride channel protein